MRASPRLNFADAFIDGDQALCRDARPTDLVRGDGSSFAIEFRFPVGRDGCKRASLI